MHEDDRPVGRPPKLYPSDALMAKIMDAKSIVTLADDLDVSRVTLLDSMLRYPELRQAYDHSQFKRKLSKLERISELKSWGYTPLEIAKRTPWSHQTVRRALRIKDKVTAVIKDENRRDKR